MSLTGMDGVEKTTAAAAVTNEQENVSMSSSTFAAESLPAAFSKLAIQEREVCETDKEFLAEQIKSDFAQVSEAVKSKADGWQALLSRLVFALESRGTFLQEEIAFVALAGSALPHVVVAALEAARGDAKSQRVLFTFLQVCVSQVGASTTAVVDAGSVLQLLSFFKCVVLRWHPGGAGRDQRCGDESGLADGARLRRHHRQPRRRLCASKRVIGIGCAAMAHPTGFRDVWLDGRTRGRGLLGDLRFCSL